MKEKTVRDLASGALAGFVATVPMTVAMWVMHRQLPWAERYPLPPRRITGKLAAKAGVRQHLDEPEERGLTLAAHFGYGTATGAIYGAIADEVPAPRIVSGVLYGLGVWAVSYLGVLPALGILRPATEHPAKRNALMIAAHVVWGASLGAALDAAAARQKSWKN